MRKICFTLAVMLLLTMLSPVVFAAEQTYGIDNLNNESGDLVIAYLGGSITEGAGATGSNRYATQLTNRYFKTKYPSKNVIEVNAGVGGTPSDLGLFRMAKDVSSKNPDVVFVEFAVNDTGRDEKTVKQNMEGIVRQLSRLPKQPVVIFLYTAKADFAAVDKTIAYHQKIADYYGIASINLNSYVKGLVDDKTIIWWDKDVNGEKNKDLWYSGDGTHPNDKGYTLYTDYIMEQFDKDFGQYFKKLTTRELPISGYEYGAPRAVSHNDTNASYTGSWTVNNSRLTSRFQDGVHETTEAGATVTYTFTGRSIGLYAVRGDEGTTASYVIDEGTPNAKTGTINNYYKHGTNPDTNGNPRNPTQMGVSTMLRNDLAFGEHTIKITTNAPTQQNGYTQNLFSFGYFFVDDTEPSVTIEDFAVLDLSGSKTDYLRNADGTAETGKIVVKGQKQDGTVVDLDSGVAFTSSNEEVATVSVDGTVTPVNQGTAVITAVCGSAEAGILISVYQSKIRENNFDTAGTVGNVSSAHDGKLTYANTYEWQSENTRTGTGMALYLKNIDRTNPAADPNNSKNKLNYIMYGVPSAGSSDVAERGVIECWFYDTGLEKVQNQIWLTGRSNPPVTTVVMNGQNKVLDAFRASVTYGSTTYNFNNNYGLAEAAAGYPLFTNLSNAPRSKGWHQLVIDYSQDDTYVVYIDGKVVGQRTAENWNCGIGSIRFDRVLNAYSGDDPNGGNVTNQELWIDDLRIYNVKTTNAVPPEARNVKVSGEAVEDQVLTAGYQFYDENGDEEDTASTQWKWQVSTSGTGDWSDIPGANARNYTLRTENNDKYVRAAVKAFSKTEPVEGEWAYSAALGPVIPKPTDVTGLIFTRLDLSKTPGNYALNASGSMTVYGTSSTGTYELTDSGRVSYLSDDRSVVTVDSDGGLTFRGDGYATVIATVANPDGTTVSARIMITVYDPEKAHTIQGYESYQIKEPLKDTHLTLVDSPVRSGEKAMAYRQVPSTATLEMWGLFTFRNGATAPQYAASAWFYDSGEKTNAKAGIYLQSTDSDKDGNRKGADGISYPLTISSEIGILDDTSDYYTYRNPQSGRANVGPGGVQWTSGENKGKGYIGTHVVGNTTALDGGMVTPTGGEPVQKPVIKRTRGWHQVTAVVQGGPAWENAGTENGYIKVFLDGIEVYTDYYVPNVLELVGGRSYYPADGDVSSYYDDMSIFNFVQQPVKPGLRSLDITGTPAVGQTLTAQADAWDKNGDAITQVKYQWKASDDGTVWSNIAGAVEGTYTVAPEYEGKYICAGVTPVSTEEGEEDLSRALLIGERDTYNVTITFDSNGSVKLGDNDVTSGVAVAVPSGSNQTIAITPNSGYEIDTATVDGSSVAAANNTITLENVKKDIAVGITFKQKQTQQPIFGPSSDPQEQTDYTPPTAGTAPQYSAVMFTSLDGGYGWTVVSTGVEIRDDQNKKIPLPVASTNITPDGKFGVRVFGAGLEKGKTYTLTPYAVVEDSQGSQTTIYGTPKTFTVK